MLRLVCITSLAVLFAAALGCESGRYSSAGFRLPVDGNVERGKATFVALGCHTCHEVSGVKLPPPTVQPPVPVVLGGAVDREVTDGYLVTSMIYPSHKLAPYSKKAVAVNGRSRMPSYANSVTARELTDVVEFLQSRYFVTRASPRYPYY